MYAKLNEAGEIEEYPYSLTQLRRDNPNTSFPQSPGGELLAEWGVVIVTPTEVPAFDRVTQNCERVNPVRSETGWEEAWEVTPASAKELKERTRLAATDARAYRDTLLAHCDWTQLADAPVDAAAWAAHRQALRDVPKQEGFPLNIDWPEAP